MPTKLTKRIMLGGAALAALSLAACSETGENYETTDSVEATADMAAPMGEAAAEMEASSESAGALGSEIATRPDIPVNLPKMAYVYDYGFRLPGQDIAALQQKHADACEAMGPHSCQIVAMSHSGEDGDYVTGRLELAVVSKEARGFGTKLGGMAQDAGGEQVVANITGEDLSKSIVDTEARLASRIVLRDRLLEVLKTRRGTVAELVEAERSVARVNEEIDQARSWLAEMRGRVAFSRVNIDYESGSPTSGSFADPIRGAWNSLGAIFGNLIAFLLVLGALAMPVGLAILAAIRVRRWAGWTKPEAA